jgi:LysM repeat protein
VLERIEELSKWLFREGFERESSDAILLVKVAEDSAKYKVKSGDHLSKISEIFGVEVSSIQKANGMESRETGIRAGQTLIIPLPAATSTDIVAMTLLGEGGTLRGVELMKKIMTIISNRSKCLGEESHKLVLAPHAFHYWTGKDPDEVLYKDINNLQKHMGKGHALWSKAYGIAEKESIDGRLGGATHYYAHAELIPEKHRNYDDHPSWAEGDKWKETHRDDWHVYGTSDSGEYKGCSKK